MEQEKRVHIYCLVAYLKPYLPSPTHVGNQKKTARHTLLQNFSLQY